MQHYSSLKQVTLPDSWLTIGSFDGVHRGHQALIKHLVDGAHAAGVKAVVLTFFPHPAAVLRNQGQAFYLTDPEERASLLGELGVDIVITQPFTLELARTSAHDFMVMAVDQLHPSQLLVGYDFALGRGREGTVERLAELGVGLGYHLEVIQPVQTNGDTVKSSQIRTWLAQGKVAKASELLGRPFSLSGNVVPGDGRGRLLGIPTANLEVWPWKVIPGPGVYACLATLGNQTWQAVTNIGVRPTFEAQPVLPRVETHLLDFSRDLYQSSLSLQFIKRLRDEQRFPNIESLVTQIQEDIRTARQILSQA